MGIEPRYTEVWINFAILKRALGSLRKQIEIKHARNYIFKMFFLAIRPQKYLYLYEKLNLCEIH